jgi:serine/threonine protein kinase
MNQTGFIILRHVNDEITNNYWKLSYDCIRKYYPEHQVLIIDDNSNKEYLTEHPLYKTTIINSEYPGRGELLPYYYYLKEKYFENAITFVPKSIQDLKQRLSEASKILQHFHEHGIVHNDLKPEHFLIYQNRLVLIDFELSENIYLTHSKRHNFGTIPFIAPERYDPPKSITKKSDVWSMGIILLLWMTNQPLDYFISISKDSIQKKDGIIIYSETFRNEISKFLNHISDSCKKQDFQGPFWDPDLFNLCIEMLNPNPKLRPIFSFSNI